MKWHDTDPTEAPGQWLLVSHTVRSLSQWAHALDIQSCMCFVLCVVYFLISLSSIDKYSPEQFLATLADRSYASHSRCENSNFIATQRVFKNGQENIRKQGFKTHQGLFKTYLAKTRFNFSCKSKATKACNRYAFPSQIFTVLHQNRNKFFQLGTAKKVAV